MRCTFAFFCLSNYLSNLNTIEADNPPNLFCNKTNIILPIYDFKSFYNTPSYSTLVRNNALDGSEVPALQRFLFSITLRKSSSDSFPRPTSSNVTVMASNVTYCNKKKTMQKHIAFPYLENE